MVKIVTSNCKILFWWFSFLTTLITFLLLFFLMIKFIIWKYENTEMNKWCESFIISLMTVKNSAFFISKKIKQIVFDKVKIETVQSTLAGAL